MDIFHNSVLPNSFHKTVLCVGNFDGVHLGHQKIIETARQIAGKAKIPLVIYTFWPHPAQVLVPKSAPKMIQTQAQKIDLLKSLGISAIVFEPFTIPFSKISAEDFLTQILQKRLRPAHIFVGFDFTFGYHRMGKVEDLKEWGKKNNVQVSIMEPIFVGETLVSSSAIRRLLVAGEVGEARTLLGRAYVYSGKVVRGDARGASVGFPTANLDGYSDMLVGEGVYATWAELEGRRYASVTNVGSNPTFVGERPIHVETHIFDFKQNLYGKDLSVSFVKRLRGEQHFDGIDALRTQIMKDCNQAKKILDPLLG